MDKNFYSVYVSAFNLIQNEFDYKYHVDNFCEFVGDSGDVTICCNSSIDNTLEELKNLTKKYKNLNIIESAESYDNPGLDGILKNIALQATKNPIKLSFDMDEAINLSLKDSIDSISEYFLNSNYQAAMLPVINIIGDKYHYKDINFKWRIHKQGLFRGVVNFARQNDGTHSIELSDGCELISADGNLVSSVYLIDPSLDDNKKLWEITNNNIPWIWHYGLLDFEKKAARNRNFWAEHWKVESGREVEVELSVQDFENKYNGTAKLHNLPIE